MIQIDLLIKNLGNIVEEVIAEIIDMRKGILEVGAEIEVEGIDSKDKREYHLHHPFWMTFRQFLAY